MQYLELTGRKDHKVAHIWSGEGIACNGITDEVLNDGEWILVSETKRKVCGNCASFSKGASNRPKKRKPLDEDKARAVASYYDDGYTAKDTIRHYGISERDFYLALIAHGRTPLRVKNGYTGGKLRSLIEKGVPRAKISEITGSSWSTIEVAGLRIKAMDVLGTAASMPLKSMNQTRTRRINEAKRIAQQQAAWKPNPALVGLDESQRWQLEEVA